MKVTWIVVADAARARVFAGSKAMDTLKEVNDLVNAEGRLKEGELVTDKPGRGMDRGGKGGTPHRSGYTGEETAKTRSEEEFAKYVADELDLARQEGHFGSLVLVAAPKFLGQLRERLSSSLQQMVVEEIDKDLVSEKPDEIRERIEFLQKLG